MFNTNFKKNMQIEGSKYFNFNTNILPLFYTDCKNKLTSCTIIVLNIM